MMGMVFTLELHLLTLTRAMTVITLSVGGISIVMIQHCTQDLLTTT